MVETQKTSSQSLEFVALSWWHPISFDGDVTPNRADCKDIVGPTWMFAIILAGESSRYWKGDESGLQVVLNKQANSSIALKAFMMRGSLVVGLQGGSECPETELSLVAATPLFSHPFHLSRGQIDYRCIRLQSYLFLHLSSQSRITRGLGSMPPFIDWATRMTSYCEPQ
jgi:hypothetical protein